MNKNIYIITGLLSLAVTGSAFAQDDSPDHKMSMRGHGSGHDMSMMDTDKNGVIEKSEFEAMLSQRFADTDPNNNGITFEEYQAKADADKADRDAKRAQMKANKAERGSERMKKRFDDMDADKDGKISAQEYSAAGSKMFERMDRDKDGILNDKPKRGDKGPRHKKNMPKQN